MDGETSWQPVDAADGPALADSAVVREWDALVDRSDEPRPWLRPGWVLAWWRAFGRGRLALLTLRRSGRPAALVPLARTRRGVSSPTNYHTPAFDVVAEDPDAGRRLVEEVFRSRPGHVRLRFLPAEGQAAAAVRATAGACGYRLVERTLARSPYVDADATWQDYRDTLGGKLRRELRRRRRRLEAQGRVTVTIDGEREGLDELLDECFRIEAIGRRGRGGAIASDTATASFYREACAWAADHGMLRIARLRLDQRAIAFDLAFEERGRHYLLKTGYDPGFAPLALGLLLRAEMIERAFGTGLRSYEFLGTDEAWKLAWARSVRELVELRAFGPTVSGTAGWAATTYLRPAAVRVLERAGR
ncbi:MAG TPA: GNAT family N-acetyltransferase [Acidimicrobiales bacterium]